jgi:hypothetical protein
MKSESPLPLPTTTVPQSPERPSLAAFVGRRSWFLILVIVCTSLAMAWRTTVTYPTDVFDFYPLYFGAKSWLQTGNAYALQTVVPESHQSWDVFKVGNAYPLPAVLLALPLSFLSPTVAATIWVGLLTAGMLLALRLCGLSLWWAFSLPIVDGIRIEQYSLLAIIGQIVALWALRARRPWLLALCCALLLTKPNQCLFFVIAIAILARNWFQQGVAIALIWGGSLLLDPNWVFEWLPTLAHYRDLTHQPFLWAFALFAIPFLLMRDWLAAANILQFLTLPFPINSTYAAGGVPLTVLDDRRSYWLALCSHLWILLVPVVDRPWATALAVLVPTTVFAGLRHYGWTLRLPKSLPAVAPGPGD